MLDLLDTAERLSQVIVDLTRNAGFAISHSVRISPETPHLRVIFEGPDAAMLTENDSALLAAISHIALQILRFDDEEGDAVLFELLHDEADLRWEFSRSSLGGGISTVPARTQAPLLRQTELYPRIRNNMACVSDSLWNELVHFRAAGGVTHN